MRGEEKGQLTLETVPDGSGEEAVISYLAKLFKNASRDALAASVKRVPIVLSRNVPFKTAKNIIAHLERLGASAVYSPNGSQKPTTAQERDLPRTSATDLRGTILSAFQGELPRLPVSALYTLGLSLVALAMLLLPLIYLGLIGSVAYLFYWHATANSDLLFAVKNLRVNLFTYLAPMLVGALLLLFMIKPLFVRQARRFRPSRIAPEEEPLLFAFVERLCKKVGSPMPKEIHLDTNVNASASFRRGLLSIFSNDLVLTIGLPLAGGLNLTQFAGVLAHEFGHFAQAAGMRITYLIRAVNFWFERVVYEEDEWDERIYRWSREWDFRIAIALLVARLFIWITRKILWALMFLGHAISSFMLRQMEYDADRYETHLVGSKMFESTVNRLAVLSLAHQWSSDDLGNSWEEGRLVDDFPALVLANERLIPKDTLQEVLRDHFTGARTGLFDTHPTDRDRIENARKLNATPLFKLDAFNPAIRERIDQAGKMGAADVFRSSPPASILFRNFEALSRRVSLDYYRGVLGRQVMPKSLVSVDVLVKNQDEEWEYSRALDRFCQGQFNALRPLGLPRGFIETPVNPNETLEIIKSSRESIQTSGAQYSRLLKSFTDLEDRIMKAFQIQALLDAGLHLAKVDIETMQATFQAVQDGGRISVLEEMELLEKNVRARMIGSLQLLTVPALTARMENVEGFREEADRLMKTSNVIETQLPALRDLNIACGQLGALVNQLGDNEDNEKLVKRTKQKMEDVRKAISRLKSHLVDTPYPFEHTQANMTLGDFAFGPIPEGDDLAGLLETAYEAMNKLMRVYARLIGRLARIAEMAEQVVGFPPLPEPPQV